MLFKIQATLFLMLNTALVFAQTITLPNGSIYEGELKNTLLSGEGSLTYPNGDQYTGHFKSGMFNGAGVFSYQNGITYDGHFKDGNYQGLGKYSNEEFSYEGNFEAGKFTGSGTYIDYENSIYSGNYINWRLTGTGKITDEVGNIWSGEFEDNTLMFGDYHAADGTHYNGGFSYQQFNGLGTLTYPNGDQYIGQFNWGKKEGKGALTLKQVNTDQNEKKVITGTWSNDEYQDESDREKQIQQQRERETYIYNQQSLLNNQFNALKENQAEQKEFYALTIAAYGNQSVFASEVNIINNKLMQFGISENHQITLMNSLDNLELPWATHHAIKQSLNQIENKMDINEDILLMYATSHGNAQLGLSINIHNMSLGSITPTQLSNTMQQINIKWKVIIISACYSGVFIDALKDENNIIITAADSTHTSFGCSNDLDMTYFGKAYFQDAFKNLDFISTFNEAKALVKIREEAQGYEFSNPQIHVGSNIRKHLELTTEIKNNKVEVLEFIKGLFGIKDLPQSNSD